ncbi:hypothetical protein N9M79_04665 [Alphaproteobacteria bacterium]|nr:hypothetical protein [PS1 clade bacterium]MBL6783656.1 hypothetical protein [PS1 clade bacterium]MDA8712884.1 hypothetical protein [Alphaproteobacteria bacterium]
MFARHCVTVAPGDIFSQVRPTKKTFFQALRLTPRRAAGRAPSGVADNPDDLLADRWRVAELLTFNDLPHAKLTHCGSGRQRIIALDALAQGNIYRKTSQ